MPEICAKIDSFETKILIQAEEFADGHIAFFPSDPAQVLDATDTLIRGLFACGEIVGGVFLHGYPGGSGLTSGTMTLELSRVTSTVCKNYPFMW